MLVGLPPGAGGEGSVAIPLLRALRCLLQQVLTCLAEELLVRFPFPPSSRAALQATTHERVKSAPARSAAAFACGRVSCRACCALQPRSVQALLLSLRALLLHVQALPLIVQAAPLSVRALLLSVQAPLLSEQEPLLDVQAPLLSVQAPLPLVKCVQ